MKVKFLQDRTVKAVDGETFEKDKVYDLSEASAERWIRRGVAVAAPAEAVSAKPKKSAKTAPAKS
jgi:hypothetical protein